MKELTAEWYEVSVSFETLEANGLAKRVTETIAIDAVSFGEAENKAYEQYEGYSETKVTGIKIAGYRSIYLAEDVNVTPVYYNVKIAMITIDEKTAKEKRTTIKVLVGATNHEDAEKSASAIAKSFMGECVIVAVNESKVIEILEHQ